ncbi:MAG: hypothetical protein MK077_04685 [Phycisphaerales bacterium]|nr:hypothetical protein [Phycisphaerales bacterium]
MRSTTHHIATRMAISLSTILLTGSAIAANANQEGACCYEVSANVMLCDVVTPDVCDIYGGYFYGNGTDCSDPMVECPHYDTPAACCIEDADLGWYCINAPWHLCAEYSGIWYGAGVLCGDPGVNCEPLEDLGACCWEDADGAWNCMEMEDYKCEDVGGTWYPGLSCLDIADECGPSDEPGACCIDEDGDGIYWCSVISWMDCDAAGGVFYGAGTTCSDPMVECDVFEEDGACCIEEGDPGSGYWFCVEISFQLCEDALGVWYGPGTLCSDPGINCEPACSSTPGADCAGRPRYQDPNYAAFGGGDIAVQTASPSILGDFVVTVFDLSGVATAPLDSWFALNRYAHPTWTRDNLGSIFGLALDGDGNIYVTATKTWNTDDMGPAGWGAVYKIDTYSGAISTFALLPNAQDGSLGSITYDCDHEQFFVSNFGDGRIYRLDMSGAIIDFYDHGTPWNGNGGWTALGDRPWAVEAHDGRLYYSLWNEDLVNYTSTSANEVWSIKLDPAGGFIPGTTMLEITTTDLYAGQGRSAPIADMRFTQSGSLLLAERSMQGNSSLGAHQSRLLEYECTTSGWTPSVNSYEVGGSGYIYSSTGGCDATPEHTWCGADAMKLTAGTRMYGIQGLPTTGGSVIDSVLIDYQDNLTWGDKTMLGDVVVASSAVPQVDCPTIQVLDVDCIGVWAPYDFELTFGVSNMDPSTTITSVSLFPPAGTTLTPDHVSMALPPLHSWAFDTVLEGAAQGSTVCIDLEIGFHDGSTCTETMCIDLPYCVIVLPGDIDLDGVVAIDDLMIIISRWGEQCDDANDNCQGADLDESGQIDMGDLLMVIANWTA